MLFEPGSDRLRPAAAGQLGRLLAFTRRTPGRIVVTGHTDVGGDEQDNLALSGQRAAAVADWLADHGIARARIGTEGKGSCRPVEPVPTTAAQH